MSDFVTTTIGKSSSLVLHCGGHAVTLDEVKAVITPPPTRTWCPVPHHEFWQGTLDELQASGLEVADQALALSKGGQRFFGLASVRAEGQSDFELVVGAQSSHDMSWPKRLMLGSKLFVCDNLSFGGGEVSWVRKHTPHIRRDLPALLRKGISQLADLRGLQERRFTHYQGWNLEDRDASHLIVQAACAGALAPSHIHKVVEQWQKPKHKEFQARTVWSLMNAFTEIWKSGGLDLLPRRSTVLTGLLDKATHLLAHQAAEPVLVQAV